MNERKNKHQVLVTHFSPELLTWMDTVRGKKSRQAWLARLIKDIRMDYELEILLASLAENN